MSSATMPGNRSLPAVTNEKPNGLSLAVADVGWFNTENLFREIDRESVDVLLLKCFDYVNGWRRGVYPWSRACRLRRCGDAAWEQQLVLPSGWMKRFPRLGMRPIARSVREWCNLQPPAWRRGLVMSYPHYLHLHKQLEPDVSIYYNIDDYALYWPRAAQHVRALERAMVRTADVTICVSRLRADELRASVPEAAWRIHHVPHGAPTAFLAQHPLTRPAQPPADLDHLPRPYLGFIGSLEDRLDGPDEPGVSQRLDCNCRSGARAGRRALVEHLFPVLVAAQRSCHRLAPAGLTGQLLSNVRRVVDSLPDGSPLQPGL
jgi:hypothetical protein